MTVTLLLHSILLATGLAATVAIGLASASIYGRASESSGTKADRLPLAVYAASTNLTVETREDGVSILSRGPLIRGG